MLYILQTLLPKGTNSWVVVVNVALDGTEEALLLVLSAVSFCDSLLNVQAMSAAVV